MRYPEDKIKEAILHPDLDVRDVAIRYFYNSTTPDHTLMTARRAVCATTLSSVPRSPVK